MADTIFKIPKLKGSSNYDIWALKIESIIIKEGYLDYIIADFSSSSAYLESKENNIIKSREIEEKADKATSIIRLSLEDGPLLQTRFIKNPFTLFNTLKNLYCAQGFSSEFILSKELINTTINSYKGNLELYINNFKRIINNLESRNITLPSNFVVALLLNNLNKDYEYIVTIITQTIRVNNNSTIDIDSIIAQLLDESRRLNSIKNRNSYNNYYKPNNNPNNNSFNKGKNSSNSYSNDIEMSLQTSNKNNNSKNTKTSIKCSYCKKLGHLEDKCFKKHLNLAPKSNKSINTTNSSIKDSNLEEDKIENALVSSKVNKVDNNKNIINFILDSGATIHTCYIKELFTSINSTNTSIKWGNTNTSIKASGIGDIELIFTSTNKRVLLKDVLYIPELGVNLLSLSLITSKDYSLSFNKHSCYIYTPNKSLLTKGSYKEGVSIFSTISSKPSSSIKVSNKPIATLNTFSTSNLEENIDTSNLEKLDYNSSILEEDSDLDLIDPNAKELEVDREIDLDINNNLELNSNSNSNKEEIVLNKNTIELVHKRLGHINLKAIKKLINNTKGLTIDLKDIDTASISLDNCITCIQSKLTKNRSTKPSTKVSSYLDLIYIDIGGPIRPKTFRGFKYYITFRDSYTKYLVVKLLKLRKSIVSIVESTINELELEAINNSSNLESSNFNNNKVKTLQLDNEFKSRELDSYLTKKGIVTRYSSPYTPEQNGSAEIINRILFNKVRALLISSNLPNNLWGEAILTATYLYNRTPNSSIDFKTPYYLKYNKIPNLDNIRIFGSLVYYKEPSAFTKKLDSKATPYYLIGFIGSNIYKICNPKTNKVITTRDCKIIEGYYYKPNNSNNIQEIFTKLEDLSPKSNSNSNKELEASSKNTNSKNKSTSINKEPFKTSKNNLNLEDYSEDELALNTSTIIEEKDSNSINTIDIDNKQDWKSLYNKAIIYNLLNTSSSINNIEPKSFKEVLLNKDKDKYLDAMKLEIDDLVKSNTWDLVIKPNNTPIIKGRWVLNKKLNLDNTIRKYKARWVAKGFLQKYNINYKETFASTSKPTIIRLLLAISAYLDWEIYTWDIKQAFPNAEIDINNIYIQLPIGLEEYILVKALENKDLVNKDLFSTIKQSILTKNYSKIVCKLNKALYGLKQASRQWQLFLTNILENLGFYKLKIDNSVFIHKEKAIILATHVDDILVFAKDIILVNNLYKDLSRISRLEVTNLGEIKEFLGVEVIRERSKRSLIITQRSFINKILTKYNKLNNKPKNLPLPIGVKLTKNLDPVENNNIIKDFQQEIGSLIYLTIFTRPDLVYSVNYLARFMSNPSLEHYNYLNYIFSYLVQTKELGLDLTLQSLEQSTISNTINNTKNSINIIGISDADWGGDLDSRKSTTANIFTLNNSKDNYNNSIAISWLSKLQKVVAISSAEAEYIALKEATKESLYLQSFIKELTSFKSLEEFKVFNSINTIKTDSLSAIELAKNPIYHARTKHVDITYHFVRENLLSKNIDLVYENTSTILADNLTKATSFPKFNSFKSRISLIKLRRNNN
jgi:hypothetical protein